MIKNVISSKGKFASHLYMRNSMVDPKRGAKKDKALGRSSMLLSKTFSKQQNDDDILFMVNPKNVSDDETKNRESVINDHDTEKPVVEFKPKSNLTPFLLLIALSLHGFFEGVALGIQGELNGVLFLGAAILAHKWAEAFTLVRIINTEITTKKFIIFF